MVIESTVENFHSLIGEGKVLLQFYAEWCGPCRMISPHVEAFAEENSDIKVVKFNIKAGRELAIEFGVRGIPSLLALRDGEMLSQSSGYLPKEKIAQWFFSSF